MPSPRAITLRPQLTNQICLHRFGLSRPEDRTLHKDNREKKAFGSTHGQSFSSPHADLRNGVGKSVLLFAKESQSLTNTVEALPPALPDIAV